MPFPDYDDEIEAGYAHAEKNAQPLPLNKSLESALTEIGMDTEIDGVKLFDVETLTELVQALLSAQREDIRSKLPKKIVKDTQFDPPFAGFVKVYGGGDVARVHNATLDQITKILEEVE